MPVQNFSDGVKTIRQQLLKEDAIRQVASLFALGAGAGIAGRSALGAAHVLNRNLSKPKHDGSLRPYVVGIEPKVASFTTSLNSLLPAAGKFMSGENAQTVAGLPWFLPAAAAATAGGAYGGYKAVDYLLDRNRKGLLKSELARAKQEYEQALTGTTKTAAENTLAHDLDILATEMVKRSLPETGIGDALGGLTGLYLLGALGTAGYVGSAAYANAKKNSRKKLLEKARKQVGRDTIDAPLYAEVINRG